MIVRGVDLTPDQRDNVLCKFMGRRTHELNTKYILTDAQWLEARAFCFDPTNGELSNTIYPAEILDTL